MTLSHEELLTSLSGRVAEQSSPTGPLPFSDATLDNTASHDFVSFEYLLDPSDALSMTVTGLSGHASNYLAALIETDPSPELLELSISFLLEVETILRDALHRGLRATYPYRPAANHLKVRVDMAFRAATRRLYGPDRAALPDMLDLYVLDPSVLLHDFLATTFRADARNISMSPEGRLIAVSPEFDMAAPDHAGFAPVEDGELQPIAPPTPKPFLEWSWIDYVDDWSSRFADIPGRNGEALFEYPFEVFPHGSVNVGIATYYRQDWRLLGIQPGDIVKTIPLGPGQVEKVSLKITRRRKTSTSSSESTETESSSETSDTTKDSTDIVREATSTNEAGIEAKIEAGFPSIGLGGSISAHTKSTDSNMNKGTAAHLSETMQKTAQKMKRESKVTVATESETGYERTSASEITNKNDEIAIIYCYHTLQRQYEAHTYLAQVRTCVFVAEALPLPHAIDGSWVRRHDYILSRALLDESFRATLNELSTEATEPVMTGTHYADMMTTAEDSFAKFAVDGLQGGAGGGLSIPDIYSEPQQLLDQHLRDELSRERQSRSRTLRANRLLNHIRANILHYSRAIWLSEDPDQRLLRYRKEGRVVPSTWTATDFAPGSTIDVREFEPNEIEISLVDLIDQTGPIGTVGNYLVFALRPEGNRDRDAQVDLDTTTGQMTLPLADILDLLRAPYVGPDGSLVDPARQSFEDEVDRLLQADPGLLSSIGDDRIRVIVSYLPRLRPDFIGEDGQVLRDSQGDLSQPLLRDDFVDFLQTRDATRRFLVETQNLYLSLHVGPGVALEPFKRAHRYIDVLKAEEERLALALKNARRALLKDDPSAFDPDIAKVVIAGAAHVNVGEEA